MPDEKNIQASREIIVGVINHTNVKNKKDLCNWVLHLAKEEDVIHLFLKHQIFHSNNEKQNVYRDVLFVTEIIELRERVV